MNISEIKNNVSNVIQVDQKNDLLSQKYANDQRLTQNPKNLIFGFYGGLWSFAFIWLKRSFSEIWQ